MMEEPPHPSTRGPVLRDEFDAAIAELNDRWGVATWAEQPDGILLVTLDDGDTAIVQLDGSWKGSWEDDEEGYDR